MVGVCSVETETHVNGQVIRMESELKDAKISAKLQEMSSKINNLLTKYIEKSNLDENSQDEFDFQSESEEESKKDFSATGGEKNVLLGRQATCGKRQREGM
ncbi:hypothetical protein HWI79_534 [Cryptosporidium felis]|nr:hypothetical protein HWI79_534 [Cryptosporidium felis]